MNTQDAGGMFKCLVVGILFITTISIPDHAVSPSDHGIVKCCDDGEGLVFRENLNRLECVKMQNHASMLQLMPNTTQNIQKPKFLNCTEPDIFRLDLVSKEAMMPDVIRELQTSGTPTTDVLCVDELISLTNRVSEPNIQLVQVSCVNSTVPNQMFLDHKELKFDEELMSRGAEFQSPRYRLCCGPGEILPINAIFCSPGKPRLPFNDTNWDGIPYGNPTCAFDSPLVSYYVDESKLWYEPDTGMSIEVSRKGYNEIILINASNSCLSVDASSNLVTATICMDPSFCTNYSCTRFCCPLGRMNHDCGETFFDAKFHIGMNNEANVSIKSTSDDDDDDDDDQEGLLIGKPNCSMYFQNSADSGRSDKDCSDISSDHENSCMVLAISDPILPDGVGALVCFPKPTDESPRIKDMIVVILALTSCCFLFGTLFVYVCVPSLQNLHGKILMCYATSLFFAYACLAANQMVAFGILNEIQASTSASTADNVCDCLAYMMLFSFHSAFLWLNVMSFDIWWTFGGMRGNWMGTYASNANATKRRRQRTRFILYCGYAWGLGFLLIVGPKLSDNFHLSLAPHMGSERCWFSNSRSEVIFFILPITVTLVLNSLFFIVTAHRCSKIKAELNSARANHEDQIAKKFHSRRARLKLNAKLFVVMGLPWLIENLSAYSEQYSLFGSYLNSLVDFLSMVNLLQGPWLFILFALKSRVYRELRKQFVCCGKCTAENHHNNEICIRRGKQRVENKIG